LGLAFEDLPLFKEIPVQVKAAMDLTERNKAKVE